MDPDTNEFRICQKEWWEYYAHLMNLRAAFMRLYNIAPPDWENKIMEDHIYLGCFYSKEDFVKFMGNYPGFIHKQKVDKEEEYEADVKRKAEAKAKWVKEQDLVKENVPPENDETASCVEEIDN